MTPKLSQLNPKMYPRYALVRGDAALPTPSELQDKSRGPSNPPMPPGPVDAGAALIGEKAYYLVQLSQRRSSTAGTAAGTAISPRMPGGHPGVVSSEEPCSKQLDDYQQDERCLNILLGAYAKGMGDSLLYLHMKFPCFK